MDETAVELIKLHEGFRAYPYLDTVGVLTIGYGRNLRDWPFTEEEAEQWLRSALERIWSGVVSRWPKAGELTGCRKAALQDMAYNLGVSGVLGFKRMRDAIDEGDWERAAKEAQNSRWYYQVGKRGARIVHMLRHDRMLEV